MLTKPKKAKPFKATKQAMTDLRNLGFMAWEVESRIPHTFITRDCHRFADILANRPGVGILLIQVTAGGGSKGRSNLEARRRKLQSDDIAPLVSKWLSSGGRVEIWNYEGDDHVLQRVEITLDDLPAEPEAA